MLLAEWQKVLEIDARISEMHRELADLYRTRSQMVGRENAGQQPGAAALATADDSGSVEHEYRRLVAAWERYSITIPPLSRLQKRLVQARQTIRLLAGPFPAIADQMHVLLVPPASALRLPVSAQLRAWQGLTGLSDYHSPDLPAGPADKTWRVLIAYGAASGLPMGRPKQIMAEESYMLAGYDMRSLGVREYAALNLQLPELIDDGSWTALLKDYAAEDQVVYGGFMGGRFRFELEDADTLFDNDRFRPALEIKA